MSNEFFMVGHFFQAWLAFTPQVLQALLDFLNSFFKDPEYEGARRTLVFLGSVFTAVRVALPPALEYIHARRLAATTMTSEGVVTYKRLFEEQSQTVMDQHFDLENLRRQMRALENRNEVLATLLMAHDLPLPESHRPRDLSPTEIIAESAKEPPPT